MPHVVKRFFDVTKNFALTPTLSLRERERTPYAAGLIPSPFGRGLG